MELSELIKALPGEILGKRVSRESIITPQYIHILTGPGELAADILYLLGPGAAAAVLPGCTAPSGATVLCAGAVPADVPYQICINLVSVNCGLPELHNCAADFLHRLHTNASLDMERFRQRVADILDGHVPGDFDVESLCRTFPRQLKSSYCVICIQSPNAHGKTQRDQLMRGELAGLFAEDNITSYNGETLVIHSYDGFTHPPKLPEAELSELLKKYDSCAGVSNGMRKPARLRLMYILAKRALESGKVVAESGKNIYFYDDTMLFSVVSLAAASFQHQFDSDDIISLGSPMLANIIKHDPNGRRDLLETLFQYIVNGRSTSKTAAAMHMHRNTVQNRIAIIEELIGDGFTKDGMLQAKLLVTYYILKYYSEVWHKDIVLSPLCEDKEKVVELPGEQ